MNYYSKNLCIAGIALFCSVLIANAQISQISLDNLNSFTNPSTNWKIVSDVTTDPVKQTELQTKPGLGVLVNIPTAQANSDLYTSFEHGDIDLELEFMTAKNSNSGIYLQGRYEIQLLDSWGTVNPKSGDCGGLYERWDEKRPDGNKGFLGVAPIQNVCKAPGLWQKLKISFEAPKFQNGVKVANAKIIKVVLNDATVLEDIELSGPTRGAIASDEKETGPLRIQGDHGPVAFRNIKYTTYGKERASISDVSYAYYEGKFKDFDESQNPKPKKQGKAEGITWEVGDNKDQFAFVFKGTVEIGKDGEYSFSMPLNGSGKLFIDNELLINVPETSRQDVRSGSKKLSAGKHNVKVYYWKDRSWTPPALGLFISGTGIKRQPLHLFTSFYPQPPHQTIALDPGNEPRTFRSFLNFNNKVLTHCVSTGFPAKTNFSVNTQQLSLLQLWRGNFLDASPAWGERGGSPMEPMGGAFIKFSGRPNVALLNDIQAAWPDSIYKKESYKSKGYFLDEKRNPHFNYELDGVLVEDTYYPDENNKVITREIKFTTNGDIKNLYFLVADNKTIKSEAAGYSIGDKDYLIKMKTPSVKPIVRDKNNQQELIVPVSFNNGTAKISYTIVW